MCHDVWIYKQVAACDVDHQKRQQHHVLTNRNLHVCVFVYMCIYVYICVYSQVAGWDVDHQKCQQHHVLTNRF